jgi:hypothetical protein
VRSKDALKNDATAAARSSIRRRPSIHGGRGTRPRLARDATLPRSTQSPPPSTHRRGTTRGVPPIATLLESADRHGAVPPPPPAPEPRNYSDNALRRSRDRLVREQMNASMRSRLNASRVQAEQEHGIQRVDLDTTRSARSPSLPSPSSFIPTPQPRQDGPARRSNLPTPPADSSEADGDSMFPPSLRPHPLSNSWSPDSPPIDGLGDRNRSPTPADGWEIMRSTITPDATLPSAESSFTSAAASQSFNRDIDSTAATAPVASTTGSSTDSRRDTSDDGHSDSASSVPSEEPVCDDEEPDPAEAFAQDMFEYELTTSEGRRRIHQHEQHRAREGDHFALTDQPARIEIGFRLIQEALNTEQGRERLLHVGVLDEVHDYPPPNALMRFRNGQRRVGRMVPFRLPGESPSPQSERDHAEARDANTREATTQIHDYFRRFTADSLRPRSLGPRSPPPQYEPEPEPEPLSSHPDVSAFTSRDGPEPHPVSPPNRRSQHEVADALLSGDETDLGAMRRVVERLARRDDVPAEWWTSIGLNLSRARPRARSPRRTERTHDSSASTHRVRTGRVDRASSRL